MLLKMLDDLSEREGRRRRHRSRNERLMRAAAKRAAVCQRRKASK
jgi:hypothetical protein